MITDKKRNIYIMYAIVFLQGLVFYGPFATIYRQSRGISLSQIFIIESISWILMLILEVPWGWFADKYSYKKTLLISNFIFFISKIVFFNSHSFFMFFLERVLLSLSLSGLSGCDIAMIYSSMNDKDNSEKVFARYNFFSTLGFLIACFSSSLIVNISLSATAFLTILPYGIASILTFFLLDIHDYEKPKVNFKNSIRLFLNNKNFLYFLVGFALCNTVIQSVAVFLNQGQYLRSGIDMKYFGIITALAQAINLLCIKSHKFSNKFGKCKTIIYFYGLISISCICLIFTSNLLLSILLILIINGSSALVAPITIDIENNSIKNGDRATILSLYSMTGSIISASINPIIGIGADISLEVAFGICAIISALACILIIKYSKISSDL